MTLSNLNTANSLVENAKKRKCVREEHCCIIPLYCILQQLLAILSAACCINCDSHKIAAKDSINSLRKVSFWSCEKRLRPTFESTGKMASISVLCSPTNKNGGQRLVPPLLNKENKPRWYHLLRMRETSTHVVTRGK